LCGLPSLLLQDQPHTIQIGFSRLKVLVLKMVLIMRSIQIYTILREQLRRNYTH